MALEIKGLEDISKTLENLGQVGNKVAVKSVKNALDSVLPDIKSQAPEDSGQGRKHLKVGKVKKYRKSAWGGVGIDTSNWDKTKSIYFQHFGYENNGLGGRFKGKRVTKHVGWFDQAVAKCEDKALKSLEDNLLSEIDKIMR